MTARPLSELVDPGWALALAPVAAQVAAMGEFLRAEVAAGRTYLPAGPNVLRFVPSLVIPFDLLDEGVKRFEKAVEQVLAAQEATAR